jgi:hypothetical protein
VEAVAAGGEVGAVGGDFDFLDVVVGLLEGERGSL